MQKVQVKFSVHTNIYTQKHIPRLHYFWTLKVDLKIYILEPENQRFIAPLYKTLKTHNNYALLISTCRDIYL